MDHVDCFKMIHTVSKGDKNEKENLASVMIHREETEGTSFEGTSFELLTISSHSLVSSYCYHPDMALR